MTIATTHFHDRNKQTDTFITRQQRTGSRSGGGWGGGGERGKGHWSEERGGRGKGEGKGGKPDNRKITLRK